MTLCVRHGAHGTEFRLIVTLRQQRQRTQRTQVRSTWCASLPMALLSLEQVLRTEMAQRYAFTDPPADVMECIETSE
jgi:hypothetical protein